MAMRHHIHPDGPSRWRLWACLVLAVWLTACDRTPVVIGFMGGLTGRSADLGVGGRDAVTLAVEETNAAGGLDGRPVELLSVDDRQEVSTGQRALQTLQEAGVAIAVGPMTSAVAAGIAPQLEQGSALVLVSPTVTSSAFDGVDDRIFRVISSTRDYARVSARFQAERRGMRRVAVVLDQGNLAYTQRWLDDFETEFARRGGQIVGQVAYNLQDQPLFSKLVADALVAKPDGLLFLASAADTALLVQQARKLAPSLPLLSSEWSATQAFITLGGAAAEGVHQAQFMDRNSRQPAYLDFVARFKHRFGREPGFAEVAAYDAAQVALQALRERRSGEDIKQTLLRVRRFEGLQQPVVFNDTGDAHRDAHITVVREGRYWVEP